jgi:Xaa-Pro aminopeptidase
MIKIKIIKLKKLINLNNLDGYLVPKNDAYFSEFSSPDRLKTITNFSGSAGYAIILKKENFLFIDGRYTIQAQLQSGKYFKIIEISKYSLEDVLKKYKKKLLIGFDPQLFTSLNLKKFNKICKLISIKKNLIDKIYKPKNKKNITPFYSLNQKITGESLKSKINRLVNKINSQNIENIFISAPENVAWLLNLRGKDNPNSPIPNSKIILTNKKKLFFFSCPKKIYKMKKNKSYKNFIFCEYKNFPNIVNSLRGKNFSTDELTCSLSNEDIIKLKFKIKCFVDPCYTMKSIKNKSEIKHMINSHIEDGLALTKFIFWIKNKNKKKITEIDAQNKLEHFRKLSKNYLFPSFNTIAGTGSNGAIVHYRASKKSSKVIKKNDIFLCDSGGQYKFGTTDVTRTMCFSKQPNTIKNIYTKVLKGHIAMFNTNLNKFNRGKQIDSIARQFLKRDGLDYAHGTGHGVGFFLNVHEGPQSISKYNNVMLKKGMIISNEPGYYKKNHFGIRIENLVYIKENKKKLSFENLTLAPIEKDLINYSLLTKNEKNYLFTYHLKIYAEYSKFLNLKERKWLASLI